MNAIGATVTVGLAVLAAAIGCSSSDSAGSPDVNPDSETNWLRVCDVDADCGRGLSCICNTCTRTCDSDACTAVSLKAECVTPAPAALSAACPGAPRAPLCTRSCSRDVDCTALGAALRCVGGACLASDASSSPLDAGAGGRTRGGGGASGSGANGSGGTGGTRVTGSGGGAGVTGGAGSAGVAGGVGVTGGAGGESIDAGTDAGSGPFALANLDTPCGGGPTGRQLLAFIHLPYEGTYTPPDVRAPEYPWNGPTTPSPLTVGAAFNGGTILCTIDHFVCPPFAPCRAPIPPTISLQLDVTFKTADGVFDEALTATATYSTNRTSVLVQAELPATQIRGSYPVVAGSRDQVKLTFSGLFEGDQYTGGISEVLVGQVSFSGGGWAETAVGNVDAGSP